MMRNDSVSQFTKLNWLAFAWAFLVIQAVIFPLFLDSGLSHSEAFLIMGVFSVTMAVLDIPSGYLSDRIGRRRTLIFAGLMKGIGGGVLVFGYVKRADPIQSFACYTLAYVFIGIANSLLSGTDVALLYETAAQAPNAPPVLDLLARRNLYSKYGTAISSLLGGWVATQGYVPALVLNAVFAWLALTIVFTLKEPSRKGASIPSPRWEFGHVREIFREMSIRRTLVGALVTLSLIFVAAQWSFQSFWKQQEISPMWMGLLWAVYNLMGGHAVKFLVRIMGERPRYLVISSLLIAGVGLLAAGLLPKPFNLLACLVIPLGLSPALVQFRHLLNHEMKPAWRATVNSIDTFLSRIIFFVVSPVLGWALADFGFGVCFTLVAAMVLIAAIALWILGLSQASTLTEH